MKKNRIQGMVRSIDQWRNMVSRAVALGSQAQVEYALKDAKHDIDVLWRKVTSQAAELAAVKEMYAREGAKALYELERAERAEARLAEALKALEQAEQQLDYGQWKEYVMAKCGPISTIRSRDEAVAMAQTMADLYGQSIVDEFDRMEKARAGDENPEN